MKYRNIHLLGKCIRKNEIKRIFKVFFNNVDIKPSKACKDDVMVYCKANSIRLTDNMMLESQYIVGYNNALQKAIAASHFIHANLNRYGTRVDTPAHHEGTFVFYVSGAYRRWNK